MKVELDRNVVQTVINYLKTKPFGEVNGLIGALMQCKEIEEPESKNED